MILYTHPDLVRMERAKDYGWAYDGVPNGGIVFWHFGELSTEGATGDPRSATPEKGDQLFDAIVDHSVNFLQTLDAMDWKYGVRE